MQQDRGRFFYKDDENKNGIEGDIAIDNGDATATGATFYSHGVYLDGFVLSAFYFLCSCACLSRSRRPGDLASGFVVGNDLAHDLLILFGDYMGLNHEVDPFRFFDVSHIIVL